MEESKAERAHDAALAAVSAIVEQLVVRSMLDADAVDFGFLLRPLAAEPEQKASPGLHSRSLLTTWSRAGGSLLSHDVQRDDDSDVEVHIAQLRLLKQAKACPSCGLHMVYNVGTLWRALQMMSDDAAVDWLRRAAFSRGALWKCGATVVSGMQARGQWAEWEEEAMQQGVLERSHLQWLMQVAPFSDACSSMTECAESSLKTNSASATRLRALQASMAKLLAAPRSVHIFFLGIAVHWVAVFVNKLPAAGGGSRIEVLYLDSENKPVLGTDDAALEAIMAAADYSMFPPPHEGLREFATSGFRGARLVVPLIADAAAGKRGLDASLAEVNVAGFLQHFHDNVDGAVMAGGGAGGVEMEEADAAEVEEHDDAAFAAEATADWQHALCVWLRDWFPPAVIERGVMRLVDELGLHRLPSSLQQRLQKWHTRLEHAVRLGIATAPGMPAAVIEERRSALPRLLETLTAMRGPLRLEGTLPAAKAAVAEGPL